MIRSMTGFGTAAKEVDGARYVIEVRSLNSKYFKAVTRVPEELQGLEPELESAVASRLNRGSITLTVRFSDSSADAAAQINTNALQRAGCCPPVLVTIFDVDPIIRVDSRLVPVSKTSFHNEFVGEVYTLGLVAKQRHQRGAHDACGSSDTRVVQHRRHQIELGRQSLDS